jgi:hypothetical protein
MLPWGPAHVSECECHQGIVGSYFAPVDLLELGELREVGTSKRDDGWDIGDADLVQWK